MKMSDSPDKTIKDINRDQLDALMRESLQNFASKEMENENEPIMTIDSLMLIWEKIQEFETKNTLSAENDSKAYEHLVHKVKNIILGKKND